MSLPEIKTLPVELANLIAAGEVIERPASVVKELVENSIDASSTIIKIELVNSGLKKIIVFDNGIGMTKEQIPQALSAHSTSKIKTSEDLFNITSLGFRGEALPSIASVSRLKISSSTNSIDGGFMEFEGGKKIKESIIPFPKGTKVEVEDLFFNTPARLKNLGNESLELYHISLIIDRIALANPSISFTLINNGKTLFKSSGDSDMLNLISSVYSLDTANNMCYFVNLNNLYNIKGYTSNNNVFRSNKNSINIIVNNRIIRNQNLLYAVTDAYKSIIPIGKYPITVLEITCDSSLIDVNVHPSKLEIRFTDEDGLRNLITSTLSNTLHTSSLIYNAKNNDIKNEEIQNKIVDSIVSDVASNTPNTSSNDNLSLEDIWNMFDNDEKELPNELNEEKANIYNAIDLSDDDQNVLDIDEDETEVKEEIKPLEFEKNDNRFSSLHYLGQYNKTYLLLEDDYDLYLIDQHAAMERCMYEKICHMLEIQNSECIELLVPYKLDYPISEAGLINEKIDDFKKMGLELESFGGATYLVRTIPTWIPKGLELEFISDIINHVIYNLNVSKRIMYESLARSLACKKSIKANMNILDVEVKALLENLDKCKMPYTCPHGRPVLVKITKYEIEKMFKRVI